MEVPKKKLVVPFTGTVIVKLSMTILPNVVTVLL